MPSEKIYYFNNLSSQLHSVQTVSTLRTLYVSCTQKEWNWDNQNMIEVTQTFFQCSILKAGEKLVEWNGAYYTKDVIIQLKIIISNADGLVTRC